MKKRIFFIVFIFSLSNSVHAQITNGQINYELRIDQWRQTCDNDGLSADDNEVRVGLNSDVNTGGTATWTSGGNGATCTGNNYVRRWQADAPSTVTNANTLLYFCTNRNNVSNSFTINHSSWEEDGTPDCSPSGDACQSAGTWAITFKSATKTPNRWWAYNGTADVASFVTGMSGDFSAKTVWRHTFGSACGSALNFGTLTSGVTYSHVNSNRLAPAGSSAIMGYSNTLGNGSSDVYYQFTLANTSNVVISTDNSGTNYDTYLRLYNSTACGTQIAFDDDGGTGTTSIINTNLCPGTYVILVEGFGTSVGDFNLSVRANTITLNGGTIAGITNGVNICSGIDPGAFTSSVDASNGVTAFNYQWEQSTTGAGSGYSNIVSATSTTYDPGTLTQTTWFRRRVTDACGTVQYSNVIQVVVNSLSTAPTSISGTTSVCVGGSTTLNAVGGSAGTGAVLNWYTGSCGGTLVGTGTSILVSPTVNTTYFVRYEGTCNNTSCASVSVTINSPSTAGLATGDYLWKGTTSTNWNTATNWYVYNGSTFNTAAVAPTINDNVFIQPPGTCVPNAVVVFAGTSNARNLTVMPGATLTLNSGSNLNISGSLYNNSGNFSFINANPLSNVIFPLSFVPGREIGGNTPTTFGILTNNFSGYIDVNQQVVVANTLNMNGNFWLNDRLILGTSPASPGVLTFTPVNWFAGPSYFRRYFAPSTNSGITGLFPLGAMPGSWYRPATIEFTSAPSGGWIESRFVSTPLSFYNGLPILNDAGIDIQNYMDEGYWEINPEPTLTGGTYTLTLRGDGIATVNNSSNLRIIKSPGPAHNVWIADGTHGTATGVTVTRTGMSGFSWFVIASSNENPLPVDLVSFNASCNDGVVELKWSTASEVNNHYFSVQRSDNTSEWKEIGRVTGNGNSNLLTNYEYNDESPLNSISYYRLVQFDYNGEYEEFYPLDITCIKNEKSGYILIYPNPTSDLFTVDFSIEDDYEGNAYLHIIDMNGRTINTHNATVKKGNNKIIINCSDLKAGAYQVKVVIGSLHLPVQKLFIK